MTGVQTCALPILKINSWAHAKDTMSNEMRGCEANTIDQAIEYITKEHDMKIVPICPELHPKYLCENIDKFSDYIY